MIRFSSVFILITVCIALFSGCKQTTPDNLKKNKIQIQSGTWRFVMDLGNVSLPFNAIIAGSDVPPTFTIVNSDEQIELEKVVFANDSIRAFFPVFQSELKLRVEAPGLVSGKWINHNRKNYSISVIGEYNQDFRFTSSKSNKTIPSRYKVLFDPNSDEPWDAILKINNNEGKLKGTFLTETGDYRYLQGNIMNNKVYLSTFDGSHAFYFEADIQGDSLLNGVFLSGTHYRTNWFGSANQEFDLTPPDKLTYLKDGFDYFDFSLPNQDGDTVGWNELNVNNKVVIVDIMGTWCPNCLDANKAIQELISEYNKSEIDLITIAFEKTDDLDVARERVFQMQSKLGLQERFLFGGKARKESASKAFPMLNHIMSYPTLIFIDKNREIRQIYTGFYGPGTGTYYEDFMEETDSLIASMINEPV